MIYSHLLIKPNLWLMIATDSSGSTYSDTTKKFKIIEQENRDNERVMNMVGHRPKPHGLHSIE